MLGLLRRTFSRYNSHHSKKLLYIHLVISQLIYCSQIWRPYLLKDITVLENVQRRGTKFILNDFTADYKTRLLSLNLLPLAMLYEFNDILFSLNLLRNLPLHFISWIMYHSVPTLHVLHHLLNLSINLPEPTPSTTLISIVFPVSGIRSPQLIFLLVSTLLKGPSSNSSAITLSIISIQVIIVHFIIYVRVISV